jgi:outer membrane lipoprotein carrier protein
MKRILSGVLALGAALSFSSVRAQEQPAAAAPAASAGAAKAGAQPAAGAEAPLPDLSSDEIAARVQAFYDGAKTFQAAFNQRYTIFAYNKKKESQGRVAFVKPGKMSWRYTNNGNRVVSDGRLLKVYDADNKQSYEQEVGKSAYPAALSFLLGEGKLTASFAIKELSAETVGFKGGYVLLAIPKEATPAYQG